MGQALESDDLEEWALAASGNKDVQNKMAVKYYDLVAKVARSMNVKHHVDLDDLIGYGSIGLLDAVSKFKPEMGFKFETYASKRIAGAILDGLRAMDIVPRSARANSRMLLQAIEELTGEFSRNPTEQEIMSYLDWDSKTLHAAQTPELITSNWASLGVSDKEMLPEQRQQNVSSDYEEQPDSTLLHQVMKEKLAESFDLLSDQAKVVINLYYIESLKFAEIAELLEVSESRICQIHTDALNKIKLSMTTSS